MTSQVEQFLHQFTGFAPTILPNESNRNSRQSHAFSGPNYTYDFTHGIRKQRNYIHATRNLITIGDEFSCSARDRLPPFLLAKNEPNNDLMSSQPSIAVTIMEFYANEARSAIECDI